MKSLRAGERIIKVYQIDCRYGKSKLFITNFGIMIENSNSMLLDLEHYDVLSMVASNSKTVMLLWKEGVHTCSLLFLSCLADDIVHTYKTIQHNYARINQT